MNKQFETTSPYYVESQHGSITEEDLDFIKAYGEERIYRAGSYLFVAGDTIDKFLYITEGTVKYFVSNRDGNEKVVYYTDRFVAIESFVHGQPVSTNAVAINDVVVYAVDASHWEELLERKAIRDLILQALAVKCRILGWQINDLSLSKPMQKIARMLCCHYFNAMKEASVLSHQRIAEFTGLHRVTVTNYLQMLRKSGILGVDDKGHILVLDREALQQLAFETYE